jgi:hypothetical protein
MRMITISLIASCLFAAGCAGNQPKQASNGPSCSSGQNGQTLGCAVTIGVTAIIKAAQND